MVKRKKDLQDELAEKAHQIWLAGLGAVAMAEEEGGKVFKGLVERGQGLESRGRERVERAKGAVSGVKTIADSYWETFGRTVDEQMTAVLHRIGVPTKDEIESLTKKVDDLTATLEKLRRSEAARARAAKPKADVPSA